MVVRDANGEAETFDFRTTAAGAATPNMFVNRSEDTLRVSSSHGSCYINC